MSPLRTSPAIMLLLVAACGGEPSRVASEVEMQMPGSMEVGQEVLVTVKARSNEGCYLQTPCEFTTDVDISSSNPRVVSLSRDHVRTPGEVRVTAHAVGAATIYATVDRIGASGQVQVVTAQAR